MKVKNIERIKEVKRVPETPRVPEVPRGKLRNKWLKTRKRQQLLELADVEKRKKEDKGKNREEMKNVSNAQEWLENNYPDKEKYIPSIYINQQLEGVLDCREYKRLEYIFISTSVDRSKFEIKGGSYEDI
ncbi:311_t:CDS:2 [Cetraspora pellucida]|uniref:311_t:CDS:1 n=1 Tax=Cetraspora pellucida TaxID=1433469 RepID=A0ACA9LU15_9GLOM|nr:311_t:CDS:2 [Cetraspora pellucida]